MRRLKWQQIVNITPEQFNQLSLKELKGYTQILASAGNKRIKRFKEAGEDSPSVDAVLKKGKFSTKDKSFQQLRAEFMGAKRFMESRTGSLANMTKLRTENIAKLKAEGISITKDQYKNFWRAYEELKKDDPTVASKNFKYAILENINKYQKDNKKVNVDDIVNYIKEHKSEIYEQAEEQRNDFEQSNPFTLG